MTSTSRWRQSALPVLPGAALLGASSQVWRDVSRPPSSSAEPLPVCDSGNASRNHGAPLHDRLHLPTYLPGVDLLAHDGLLPFLVFFVAAEGGAFVL